MLDFWNLEQYNSIFYPKCMMWGEKKENKKTPTNQCIYVYGIFFTFKWNNEILTVSKPLNLNVIFEIMNRKKKHVCWLSYFFNCNLLIDIYPVFQYTICLSSEFSWNFYLSPPNFCQLGLNKIKLFSDFGGKAPSNQ